VRRIPKMPILENRSKQLLIVQKNSGPAVYLAPGEKVVVPGHEVNGNPKVEKLRGTGVLVLREEETARRVPEKPKTTLQISKTEKQ
jgi:hypothetical protein